MRRLRLASLAAGAVVAVSSLGGCSTVVFSQNRGSDQAATVEREALLRAASAIETTKWPEPKEASFAERLTGLIGGGGDAGKDGAVKAYLAAMPATGRKEIVFADASDHLNAAAALAQAAYAAAESIRPVKSDISIVESAIAKLREDRDIYLAALKALDRSGENVESDDMRGLKSEFNSAIANIGAAADRLADSVAHDRTETLVSEPPPNKLTGSL
ncbi:MAG: hypothetical protein GC153_05380 [Alphaproteobacteria bacterium]|nr:hypothetical protein [Alphaproteobacteria bacterium]